jgi:hypothetical protein
VQGAVVLHDIDRYSLAFPAIPLPLLAAYKKRVAPCEFPAWLCDKKRSIRSPWR